MPRTITILLCAAVAAVPAATARSKGPVVPPDEGPDPRGLTVTGNGLAYVDAPARRNEASIRAAVDAARPHAMTRAVEEATRRAQLVATAAGLTLGAPQAVTEHEQAAEFGFPESDHCIRGRNPRCMVPLFSTVTVSVTFETAQTTAATPAGRALVSSGVARARVRPRDRRSSASIRRAMTIARDAAAPDALREALADADRMAQATGATRGTLLAVAERPRPYEDGFGGSFGAGRFCGMVHRAIVRRDPATGRRRVVRRVRQRRCFHSPTATSVFRVTALPAPAG